jgi:geranylgeranyl diphosphate synthase type I
MTRTLPEPVERARELVSPRLQELAGRLAPEIWAVVGYHFGWSGADGAPDNSLGGKAVRPALALLSAEAAEGEPEVALDGAAAVELVHNFSLLHDDIMDRDRERHHRATAWTMFGEPRAILAGDALVNLSIEVLLERPTPERVRAAALLSRATARMIDGQAQDLALEGRPDVTVDECLSMISAKTAALLSCASAIGAVLAGGDDELVAALSAYGEHVGVAFQAVDDQLGIWGQPAVTGKPTFGDLRQRKRSLPVAAALESGGDEARRLADLLAKPDPTEEELARAAELVENAGGRARAQEEADRRLRLALDELEQANMPDRTRAELAALAVFITSREF